jgi:hypothetical protein
MHHWAVTLSRKFISFAPYFSMPGPAKMKTCIPQPAPKDLATSESLKNLRVGGPLAGEAVQNTNRSLPSSEPLGIRQLLRYCSHRKHTSRC